MERVDRPRTLMEPLPPADFGLAMNHSEPTGLLPAGIVDLADLDLPVVGVVGASWAEDVEERCLFRGEPLLLFCAAMEVGRGGGGGSLRLSFEKWPWRTPPRCFAFLTRVARSGLDAVPGERYIDLRLEF